MSKKSKFSFFFFVKISIFLISSIQRYEIGMIGREFGLGQSLFARLDRPAVTVELNLQYRMNQQITALANSLTYSGKLQCASSATANATLSLNSQSLVSQTTVLHKQLVQVKKKFSLFSITPSCMLKKTLQMLI